MPLLERARSERAAEVLRTLVEAALAEGDAGGLATAFNTLADRPGWRLLSLIVSSAGGACACDLIEPLGRSQPTVSHHTKAHHVANAEALSAIHGTPPDNCRGLVGSVARVSSM